MSDYHLTLVDRRYFMGDFLNWLGLTGEGVEVGVDMAHFSCVLLNSWKGRRLHLVDPWVSQTQEDWLDTRNAPQSEMDARYQKSVEAVKPYGDRANIIRKFSDEASEMFADCSLDFVYIDGNHRFDIVARDMELWYPKVKSGGILSGHDYDCEKYQDSFGVTKAVDNFALSRGHIVATCRTGVSWFIMKRAA